jgi:chromosome segregation ATPase
MDDCSPELVREHERRITCTEQRTQEAHERINGLVSLLKEFTVEMRASNKNISELVTEVRTLTHEIGFVGKATEKHEEDIASIKDNMETKDTVLKLYQRLEATDLKYEKGLDAIMEKLRTTEEEFENHKLEPAMEALNAQKSLKKWLIVGFGSILLTIVSTAVLAIIFK